MSASDPFGHQLLNICCCARIVGRQDLEAGSRFQTVGLKGDPKTCVIVKGCNLNQRREFQAVYSKQNGPENGHQFGAVEPLECK